MGMICDGWVESILVSRSSIKLVRELTLSDM